MELVLNNMLLSYNLVRDDVRKLERETKDHDQKLHLLNFIALMEFFLPIVSYVIHLHL